MSVSGVVKFFDVGKGFGFIKPDDGKRDVFVHIKDLKKAQIAALEADDRVTFDIEPSDRGPRAVNISISN